jgi:2-iminobutanoate/2-iminopropanoate deaminase
VFQNLEAVLAAAGAGFGDVVKTTVYVADMADFAELNGIYAEHFTKPYPARSTVEAGALPAGARVEIDVVARLP